MSFIEKFEVADFPNNFARFPFDRRSALGPGVSCDLAQLLQANAERGEYIDLDTGEIRAIDKKIKISGAGDMFYCFLAQDETWLYIFYTDLEYGVLMEKFQSSWSCSRDIIDSGMRSFQESLGIRQGRDANYYDQEGLIRWEAFL